MNAKMSFVGRYSIVPNPPKAKVIWRCASQMHAASRQVWHGKIYLCFLDSWRLRARGCHCSAISPDLAKDKQNSIENRSEFVFLPESLLLSLSDDRQQRSASRERKKRRPAAVVAQQAIRREICKWAFFGSTPTRAGSWDDGFAFNSSCSEMLWGDDRPCDRDDSAGNYVIYILSSNQANKLHGWWCRSRSRRGFLRFCPPGKQMERILVSRCLAAS